MPAFLFVLERVAPRRLINNYQGSLNPIPPTISSAYEKINKYMQHST